MVPLSQAAAESRAPAQFTVAPPQHFLYFFPEPHGHDSFRPTLEMVRRGEDLVRKHYAPDALPGMSSISGKSSKTAKSR